MACSQCAAHVVLLHPELGLGGAERLVVDTALAIMANGHRVTLLCTFHDTGRCFAETLDQDGRERASWVVVRGSHLPRTLAGSLTAVCTLSRCAYLAAVAAHMRSSYQKIDAVVLDQVAAPIMLLRALLPRSTRLVYYCHFPDKLLAPSHRSFVRSMYRAPIDYAEETAMNLADDVIANSQFTRRVLSETMPRVQHSPLVVYPCVSLPERNQLTRAADWLQSTRLLRSAGVALPQSWLEHPTPTIPFVSINRFEKKKGLLLAVRAFATALHQGFFDCASTSMTKTTAAANEQIAPRPVLVIAGGFDSRLPECASVLQALQHEANLLGVRGCTYFLLSFSDKQKESLLDACASLVYTPVDEHFGIAPVEAMARARPVIATNSGGPMESIVDGETGWLRPPHADAFANAMYECVHSSTECERRGWNGYARAAECFAFSAFSENITNAIVHGASTTPHAA